MSQTTCHSVRVPDDVWLPAREYASEEGTNISVVINRLLKDYNTKQERKRARD